MVKSTVVNKRNNYSINQSNQLTAIIIKEIRKAKVMKLEGCKDGQTFEEIP
jgi:hypothetical protein